MNAQIVNLFDGCLVFLITTLLIFLIIKYSSKIGMLDIPNDRSSHVAPIPRGAGVAMFIAYMSVLMLFNFPVVAENIGFFLALFLVFIIGVLDDYKDTSPKVKFLFIIFSTILIFFINDLKIDTLGIWFGYEISLPLWLSLFITIFAVVGFTNALNLIDGLDGLSGMVSLVIFASLFYIGVEYNDQFLQIVSFLMIISIVSFLIFNWHPAKIFMGDSGSLVFGFAIAALSIRAIEYVSVTSILFLTALPVVDTILVMTRRIQRGQSPFLPDKTHIHHKLVLWRGSVDGTVLILVLIQVAFSIMGILLQHQNDAINFLLYIIMLFLFALFLDEKKREGREKLFVTRKRKEFIAFVQQKFSYKQAFMILVVLIVAILSAKIIL